MSLVLDMLSLRCLSATQIGMLSKQFIQRSRTQRRGLDWKYNLGTTDIYT